MRLLQGGRTRTDERRSWRRRLADDEARDFVETVLDETRDVFRTTSGEFQLEGLCRDVFATRATTDIRWLKRRGVTGYGFYRNELAPNWEGLDQAERSERIERFIELSHALGRTDLDGSPPPAVRDLAATLHVKVLLLAWAHDRTYGFMDRIFNGPLQYREHRERVQRPARRFARQGRRPRRPRSVAAGETAERTV
jgi:hypothetical protein